MAVVDVVTVPPGPEPGGDRPVLLTGFEPFDGQVLNASWEVARLVEYRWRRPERLVVQRLPVSFRGARQGLRTAVAEHRPGVVLCLGESGARGTVGIERVALNIIDAPIPDNDGSAPVDVPVVAGAPAAFFSGLPLRACVTAASASGAPVELSSTAGTYVCNATFYALMHLLDRTPGVAGGFVHVPRTPAQVSGDRPALDAAVSADAVAAMLAAVLDG